MNKFLFTDGINGVREVKSQEELQRLAESAPQADKIRIWLFSSNEWISYAAFSKLKPAITRQEKPVTERNRNPSTIYRQPVAGTHWLKKFLFICAAAAGIILVFNFTKIKWQESAPVNTSAARPANVPVMDIDSLFAEIENARGQSIDRNTKTNLRLRNTWPERILLQLEADRETNGNSSRYFNVYVSIDNTSGFIVDNAVVELNTWKNNEVSSSDTLVFETINFDKVLKRHLNGTFRGDSISVSFKSIRAKAFNFCYTAAKNNSGNYNDRWFCRQ